MKCPHHLLGVPAKKVSSNRVQLFLANKKRIANRGLILSDQRKKTEKRTCLVCGISADKLRRDSFADAKDVSSVLVIIAHERFAAELAIARRIMEPLRDFLLEVGVQNVSGAPRCIVQIRAQAQEKIVSSLDPSLVGLAQPIFTHKLIGAQRALFEIRHPEKILIIAKPATAALYVWFLQIDAFAEFLVARDLILHAHFHVFSLMSFHALGTEVLAELLRQFCVAG